MNLSDKIAELRKRSGLSQDQLGAKIGVSRQAISKWEMAQTTPDLNKILALSKFFQVPTDFLLNDQYDIADLDSMDNRISNVHTMIDLETIQTYLHQNNKAAQNYVVAIFLLFISPITGIVLSVYKEPYAVIGVIVQLLILMIVAVILIMTFWSLSKYKVLNNKDTELAFGVKAYVQEEKTKFDHRFLTGIVVGILCMIAAVIPMVIASIYTQNNDAIIIFSAFVMLMIFAFGLSNIAYVCTIQHGYNKVLKLK